MDERNEASHQIDESEVYARLGEDGFQRIVSGFYRRVREDRLLSPLYPQDDWEGAELRLRDFLVYRFGGPTRYLDSRGHPRLRMRHVGFAISQVERDRWIELMTEALEEAKLPADCLSVMSAFFEHAATFLINRPASS